MSAKSKLAKWSRLKNESGDTIGYEGNLQGKTYRVTFVQPVKYGMTRLSNGSVDWRSDWKRIYQVDQIPFRMFGDVRAAKIAAEEHAGICVYAVKSDFKSGLFVHRTYPSVDSKEKLFPTLEQAQAYMTLRVMGEGR